MRGIGVDHTPSALSALSAVNPRKTFRLRVVLGPADGLGQRYARFSALKARSIIAQAEGLGSFAPRFLKLCKSDTHECGTSRVGLMIGLSTRATP